MNQVPQTQIDEKGEAMSDQCNHCECKGNLDLCEQTECFIRESWYSITIQNKAGGRKAESFNGQMPGGKSE
jgi:hypothetical protein